jgi:plastocyanin
MKKAMRKKALYVVAAALGGVAAGVLPTLASGQSGAPSSTSFKAVDSAGLYGGSHAWQSDSGGSQATIAQGGTVSFSYSSGAAPQGSTMHNVDFSSGPSTPTCTQTQGASSGAVPPLPHQPTAPDWAGSCTFASPGTYAFHCDLHTDMTGTVVVQGAGATTTSSTGTTTSGPAPTPPAGGPAALGAVAVAASQRGATVRGSAEVGQAGSTLRVDLSAGAASAGQAIRHGVGAGRVSFAVPLNVKARRALHRRARLALTVKIRVTTPAGRAGNTTRHVTLHR